MRRKGMQQYPEPYIEYLLYFHTDRDLFECHEVLEEYWKSVPDSPFRQAWHGLIQVAVALYHERRGNRKGAIKMMESAIQNLSESDINELGLQSSTLSELMSLRLEQLITHSKTEYEDFNLPFADAQLELLCQKRALSENKIWLAKSDFHQPSIIHKHTLRDRTEVIVERQKQFVLKQHKRDGQDRALKV
jgi:predicted metal-dependent hydrolase